MWRARPPLRRWCRLWRRRFARDKILTNAIKGTRHHLSISYVTGGAGEAATTAPIMNCTRNGVQNFLGDAVRPSAILIYRKTPVPDAHRVQTARASPLQCQACAFTGSG